MYAPLKHLARDFAPEPLLAMWGRWYGAKKIARAVDALAAVDAPRAPHYLPASALDELMASGYREPAPVRYDAQGLAQRAAEKIEQLAAAVPLGGLTRTLELGCWDGLVAAALARRGASAIALDITGAGFEPRAAAMGARFIEADAGAIALADASVDLVYSFASLEHFPRPDACLREITRVLKPHGRAVITFGPLYLSPYGRHAYRQIPVPFCHLLFREEDLHAWAVARGLAHAWPYVNGWTLAQYRSLLHATPGLCVDSYQEHGTGGVGVELIASHPECFAPHATAIDEFLVTTIDVVLHKP
jgi:SAM-dependent methyltransferase